MNRFASSFKPLMWFTAVVLAAGVAGCGGGDGGNGFPGAGGTATAAGLGNGVGGNGRGPAPVNLGAASTFAILAETTITNVPTSAVTGDVGLSPGSGAAILLTCPQVTGVIRRIDAAGDPCFTTDATVGLAVAAARTAYTDANSRAPDYTELGAGNIGGLNLGPELINGAREF